MVREQYDKSPYKTFLKKLIEQQLKQQIRWEVGWSVVLEAKFEDILLEELTG